jgi:hypothetical protein
MSLEDSVRPGVKDSRSVRAENGNNTELLGAVQLQAVQQLSNSCETLGSHGGQYEI